MSADVDALPDMLARLKLTALRDRLDGLLDEAARGDLSLRETLALLCRAEVSHREERRIQMGTGIAKFPHQRTLEAFDFAAQPSLDAKQVRDLAACRWVSAQPVLVAHRYHASRFRPHAHQSTGEMAWSRSTQPARSRSAPTA